MCSSGTETGMGMQDIPPFGLNTTRRGEQVEEGEFTGVVACLFAKIIDGDAGPCAHQAATPLRCVPGCAKLPHGPVIHGTRAQDGSLNGG